MQEEKEPTSPLSEYYRRKANRAYVKYNPRNTEWHSSGASLRGWIERLGFVTDMPFKSIALFVGCWITLEIGWPLLVVLGVTTAGSVWSVPSAIPCMFIIVYGLLMTGAVNMVRGLIVHFSMKRDNLVKALFRGYFWSLLSIGLIVLIHTYFHTNLPQMFILPILYLLPIDVAGTTLPIPIPLGITGLYMDLIITILVYVVGIIGSCVGGLEIIKYLNESSKRNGSYGAILSVLILATFPAFNICFSLVFLNTTLDLIGRLLSIAV